MPYESLAFRKTLRTISLSNASIAPSFSFANHLLTALLLSSSAVLYLMTFGAFLISFPLVMLHALLSFLIYRAILFFAPLPFLFAIYRHSLSSLVITAITFPGPSPATITHTVILLPPPSTLAAPDPSSPCHYDRLCPPMLPLPAPHATQLPPPHATQHSLPPHPCHLPRHQALPPSPALPSHRVRHQYPGLHPAPSQAENPHESPRVIRPPLRGRRARNITAARPQTLINSAVAPPARPGTSASEEIGRSADGDADGPAGVHAVSADRSYSAGAYGVHARQRQFSTAKASEMED